MTLREVLRSEPWRFNFFRLFREYERSNPKRPRIGRNLVIGEEVIRVAQDPHLEFPASNVTEFSEGEAGRPDTVRVRFLGLFTPQGPMPKNTTAEVIGWKERHNYAFLHFADIFAVRFYHVLYRAWCSARRICQFDRPLHDHFQTRIGAVAGVPRGDPEDPPDSVPPLARFDVAGLIGGRVRSPVRLQQIIETVLRVDADVEEFIPLWVSFELEDRSKLGTSGSTMGADLRLGSRVQTVADKVRINIRTRGGDDYRRFLPGQPGFKMLTDLASGYLGPATDIEVAPAMPASALPALQLGRAGAVGHTSWIAPKKPEPGEEERYVQSAVFLYSSFAPHPENDPGDDPAVHHRETLH